jgi:hypothetical protein
VYRFVPIGDLVRRAHERAESRLREAIHLQWVDGSDRLDRRRGSGRDNGAGGDPRRYATKPGTCDHEHLRSRDAATCHKAYLIGDDYDDLSVSTINHHDSALVRGNNVSSLTGPIVWQTGDSTDEASTGE